MNKKFTKRRKQQTHTHTIFGINGSIQVINAKKLEVLTIDLMQDGKAIRKPDIERSLSKLKGKVHRLPKDVFLNRYKGLRTQGIVVHFKGEIYKDIPSFKQLEGHHCLLILDNVEDPQNLGQIIRTAECGGIDGIILPEHHSAGLTQTTMQISQGAFVHIPIYRCTNIRNQIKNLKKDGFWVYALENSIKAKPWHEIDLTGKSAIVLGSEGKGIRKLVLEECDIHATIPMSGSINSLNVSAATSAIVFERLRQTMLS